MKYLKSFLESKKNWESISLAEWNSSPKTVSIPNHYPQLLKTIKSLFDYSQNKQAYLTRIKKPFHIEENMRDITIDNKFNNPNIPFEWIRICALDDEWFLVCICVRGAIKNGIWRGREQYKFYKCDQIEGLISLLSDSKITGDFKKF